MADTLHGWLLLTRAHALRHACCMKMQQWNQFAGFDSLVNTEDLVCLSRTRWRWADPRLKALLAVAAQHWRVFYVEVLPPAWLNLFHVDPVLTQESKRVVRVVATKSGVWTVRPELSVTLHGSKPDKVLASVLQTFFEEAGIHEPVVWHLDAGLPEALLDQPAWATLYLKPDPQSSVCLDANERASDAALRERSDALLDSNVLTHAPEAGWNTICDEIMRAVCRRYTAPMMHLSVA